MSRLKVKQRPGIIKLPTPLSESPCSTSSLGRFRRQRSMGSITMRGQLVRIESGNRQAVRVLSNHLPNHISLPQFHTILLRTDTPTRIDRQSTVKMLVERTTKAIHTWLVSWRRGAPRTLKYPSTNSSSNNSSHSSSSSNSIRIAHLAKAMVACPCRTRRIPS